MKNVFILCIIFTCLAAKSPQTTPQLDDYERSVLTIVTREPDKCGRITDTTRGTPDIKDLVEVMRKTDAYEVGTGIIIEYQDKLYIITCEHVLYKAGIIKGFDSNYVGYDLRLVGTDMFYDVAVLEFLSASDEADFKGISFDTSEAESSEAWSIGYWKPNGEPSIEHGNITKCIEQTDTPLPEIGYIKSDVQTAGGFSGGPLLNKKGKVLGMNTSVNRKSKASYALKSKVLEKLAHNIIENDGSVQRVYAGLRFSQDATCGKVKIDGIIDDSPAAEHSEELKNQYIKSINGTPICNIYDVLMEMENMKVGDRMTIGLENRKSVSFITNPLDKESLQDIAVHALQKHYKDTSGKKLKRTKIKIDKGQIVVIHNRGKDIIKTAGIEEDRIYCLDGQLEQLGILIRLFGLHGYIELGKDIEHIYIINQIKFSAEHNKRVLFY